MGLCFQLGRSKEFQPRASLERLPLLQAGYIGMNGLLRSIGDGLAELGDLLRGGIPMETDAAHPGSYKRSCIIWVEPAPAQRSLKYRFNDVYHASTIDIRCMIVDNSTFLQIQLIPSIDKLNIA